MMAAPRRDTNPTLRSALALAWGALGVTALATAAAVTACSSDPVLSNARDALGKETAGYPQGPFHRAGQPCLVCHQDKGEASDKPFTVAGTVFAQPARQVGVEGAEVRLTDADGTKYIAKTNCAGNFFVTPSEWDPRFPVLVEVAKNNSRRSMRSAIGRDGSCGGCHTNELTPKAPFSTVGHVYLFAADEPGSPNGAADCPVDPRTPLSP
jgi:hypothetical protein